MEYSTKIKTSELSLFYENIINILFHAILSNLCGKFLNLYYILLAVFSSGGMEHYYKKLAWTTQKKKKTKSEAKRKTKGNESLNERKKEIISHSYIYCGRERKKRKKIKKGIKLFKQ